MFLDIFTALLAWGLAAAWVLTGRKKLPPEWDHLALRGFDAAEVPGVAEQVVD
jgi:hypothetical protein